MNHRQCGYIAKFKRKIIILNKYILIFAYICIIIYLFFQFCDIETFGEPFFQEISKISWITPGKHIYPKISQFFSGKKTMVWVYIYIYIWRELFWTLKCPASTLHSSLCFLAHEFFLPKRENEKNEVNFGVFFNRQILK